MDPLQQLLIERECERLLIQSMWNTDFGVASHTADLFIPDGVMYVGPNTVRGQEAIRASFLKRQAMTERTSRHVVSNIVVTVRDEHHASASCYVTVNEPRVTHNGAITVPDGPGFGITLNEELAREKRMP